MGETIDYVIGSARKGYGLIKKDAVPLYVDLLKIAVLATVVSLVGLAFAAVVAFIFIGADFTALFNGGATPELGIGMVLALVIATPIFLIFTFLSKAVNSVVYNAVENRTKEKGTGIIAQSKKNLMPVVRYALVFWAVIFVIALPIVLSLFLGGISAVAGMCFFSTVAVIAYPLFVFFTQFGMYELILGGKGAVDALKTSAHLVRANILTVALLDIIVIIISLVTGAGIMVLRAILQFIPVALAFAGPGAILLGSAIYIVLYMAVSILISTASATIIIPIVYYFWKGLR